MIAGLIALLVGRGLAGWLASLIVWGALAAVAVGAVVGFRHFIHSEWNTRVAEPYRIEGDRRTEKKLRPEIELQTRRADLAERRLEIAMNANRVLTEDIEGPGGLRAQAKASAESIERLSRIAEQARQTARRLLAELAKKTKEDAAEIARLRNAAAGPSMDFEQACREADRVLSDLAQWVRS